MTRREQLLDLRDRLAKATGPDRDLDARLHALATFSDPKWTCTFPENNEMGSYLVHNRDWCAGGPPIISYNVARFTQSLDAAVTLVPEGCEWLRKSILAMTIVQMDVRNDGWGRHFDAGAATPALALCLARVEYELSQTDEAQK